MSETCTSLAPRMTWKFVTMWPAGATSKQDCTGDSAHTSFHARAPLHAAHMHAKQQRWS